MYKHIKSGRGAMQTLNGVFFAKQGVRTDIKWKHRHPN